MPAMRKRRSRDRRDGFLMLRKAVNLLNRKTIVRKEELQYNKALVASVNLAPNSRVDLRFKHTAYHGLLEQKVHVNVTPSQALQHLGKYYRSHGNNCQIQHEVYRDGKGRETHYLDITARVESDSLPVLQSTLEYRISGTAHS